MIDRNQPKSVVDLHETEPLGRGGRPGLRPIARREQPIQPRADAGGNPVHAALAVEAEGASLEDVRACRDAGLAGVIVGKALYEKRIDLAEAIRESRS